MLKTLLWGVAIYLALGVATVIFLMQTPYAADTYADNPLWQMILLWPAFLIGSYA